MNKKYKIELTEKQLKVLSSSLECFGRLHLKQFKTAFEACFGFNQFNYDEGLEIEKFIRGFFSQEELSIGLSKTDGGIAFEMFRSIHVFGHESKEYCCTCSRSDMNQSGEPLIKVEKV